jgi:hypothetical protein
MIVVKVTYTVKEAFAEENKKNINRFLSDFKKLDTDTFQYNVYLQQNGKTFIHISHYRDKEIQKKLLQVPSFLKFQKMRDERGLEGEPSIEELRLVGNSNKIFQAIL